MALYLNHRRKCQSRVKRGVYDVSGHFEKMRIDENFIYEDQLVNFMKDFKFI